MLVISSAVGPAVLKVIVDTDIMLTFNAGIITIHEEVVRPSKTLFILYGAKEVIFLNFPFCISSSIHQKSFQLQEQLIAERQRRKKQLHQAHIHEATAKFGDIVTNPAGKTNMLWTTS